MAKARNTKGKTDMPIKTMLIVFEDAKADGFYPLSVSHSVFDLLNGCFNPIERFRRILKPAQTVLICREYLAELARKHSGLRVNEINIETDRVLIINAAIKPDRKYFKELASAKPGTAFYLGDRLVAANLAKQQALKYKDLILNIPISSPVFGNEIAHINADIAMYDHLWDLINDNSRAIADDCQFLVKRAGWKILPKSKSHSGIYIHKTAQIAKGAYFDDSLGPVILDENVVVEPRSVIQGPSYIGKGSRIMGGIIREGCSLGPMCKVGGELEESIILGYSNKCHEGFIGHAYLGQWVNLGAMTTNSDLKNNYSPVKVTLNNIEIDTKSLKVGSFIGDHTKTGIGTLFNTGIVIGFCCNLYGGGLFSQREIPHFNWGIPNNLVEFKLDKAVQIAKAAMARRGQEFTQAHAALFARIKQPG